MYILTYIYVYIAMQAQHSTKDFFFATETKMSRCVDIFLVLIIGSPQTMEALNQSHFVTAIKS